MNQTAPPLVIVEDPFAILTTILFLSVGNKGKVALSSLVSSV